MCGEFKIPRLSPEWVNKCTDCYIIYKKAFGKESQRKCKQCGKRNIGNDIPMNVLTCNECTVTYRNCITCGESNIENYKPLYIKECTECYNVSKTQPKACLDCGDKCIDRSLPNKYCNDCEEVRCSLKRECEVCGEKKIGAEEPPRKTKCIECYKNTLDPNAFRLCGMCNLPKIPISDPQWKKVCYGCYLKSKK